MPSFALSKFATPSKRDGVLFSLDTRSGKPAKTTPDASCFVEELYTQDDEGQPDRGLEALFSIVENYAAQAFTDYLADPLSLSDEHRQTLSYYLAFQYQRTPVAMNHSASSQQAMMAVMMGLQFADSASFAKRYRKIFGEASDEKVEAFRAKVMGMLKSGEIAFDKPELGAFQMMLKTVDRVATSIRTLEWTLIEAIEGEYITCDRGLAMHDSTPKFPWSGHALLSSPNAETTFPLAPDRCLCLTQGDIPTSRAEAKAEEVRAVNLRTYGWASEFIFGRSQAHVQEIRAQAKAHPGLVVSPRTSKPVILEEADPNDPTVGREHVKKGWPPGVWVDDDAGGQRYCAYHLVDPADQDSVSAVIDAEERLQRNAAGSSQPK